MQEFYNTTFLPEILKIFSVNEIIISGIKDENFIGNILNYDANITQINTNDDNCIEGNPLKILPNLKDYDAIFIDDDANWYTVFKELEIIRENNDEFPLVFICNNNFPNRRRDSYINPDSIPSNFRHEYSNQLHISYNDEKVIINDGFYHACKENTPKNGVLTAIEDFLNENNHIGLMKINFIKEISILYLKSQINQKRMSILNKNIQTEKITDFNFSDKLIENQMLISYINKYNLYDENLNELEADKSKKENIIKEYENTIRTQNNEVILKDAQISGFESKLSLKDSQIKNIESKLVNTNKKISNLENQLQLKIDDLYSMHQKLGDKDSEINELNDEFKLMESQYTNQIDCLNDEFQVRVKHYDNQINMLKEDINRNDENFKNNEHKYIEQINEKDSQITLLRNELSQKEDEFKNQINSKNESIEQKNNQLKIKQEELDSKNESIEQKNNQLKIKQEELDSKETKLNTLQRNYTKQLSIIDSDEYCISSYKDEISNNQLEIEYHKKNTLTKMILSPFAYLYLIFKSKPNELSLNLKLYRAIKNSKCFDIGFYLNNNEDIQNSKWCKYFSPELHYVCNGFRENRKFNKKYFNRNSKEELLDYILNCNY